jgi:molybdate/tungstate transport system substrate-binding protein
MKNSVLIVILFISGIICSCSRNNNQNKETMKDTAVSGKLVIFHAGSLAVPLKEIAKEFNKSYPKVEILMEAAGSLACARKLTELNQNCDIIAVSDYKVIDNMLIPLYCEWNIPFAGNEMIIAYTPNSKHASEINAANWYDLLGKKEVHFGRSDPNSDPCGYRTILTMQLADLYYNKNISKALITKNAEYIRPKETDLLALLEAKELDYIFIYKSVAIQHKLNYLSLPDSINLKKTELESFYSKAQVEINGSEPGKKQIVKGESMIYGISIPKTASNKMAGEAVLAFLLSTNQGMKIMQDNGQTPILPVRNVNYSKMSKSLQKFVLAQ